MKGTVRKTFQFSSESNIDPCVLDVCTFLIHNESVLFDPYIYIYIYIGKS